MGVRPNGRFIRENPTKWMMNRGTPYLINPHIIIFNAIITRSGAPMSGVHALIPRTVMVVGDGSQTGTLCNLIAGKDGAGWEGMVRAGCIYYSLTNTSPGKIDYQTYF